MNSFQIDCAGYKVNADWYEGRNSDHILLTLFGWTSNRQKQADIVEAILQNTGMSAAVVEYSGHGESPININLTRPAQHFLEVIDTFDMIRRQYPNAKITVMGTSYGGFMAAQLTKYREFDRLVLRAPAIYKASDFYSLQPDIDRGLENEVFRKDTVALSAHPLLTSASKFAGKTLVVVHEKDETVPIETTNIYTKVFNADKYIAKNFVHRVGAMSQNEILVYQDAICEWLNNG